MSSVSNATRRIRAGMMMLAAAAVLAASLVPACGSLCCAREDVPAVHASMRCCETQPKVERSEVLRMPQAVSVSHPAVTALPAEVTADAAVPPSIAALRERAPRHRESSPPLFLRNAQLLI